MTSGLVRSNKYRGSVPGALSNIYNFAADRGSSDPPPPTTTRSVGSFYIFLSSHFVITIKAIEALWDLIGAHFVSLLSSRRSEFELEVYVLPSRNKGTVCIMIIMVSSLPLLSVVLISCTSIRCGLQYYVMWL